MSEKPDPVVDAEHQRELAIARAELARDGQNAQLAQREADYEAVDQLSPQLAYDLERGHVLANKACSERIGDAWREYFDRRLTEHDQAYEEHMRSLGS
jgi:hypothetical protein